jgi:peptidylprolyl isomerase
MTSAIPPPPPGNTPTIPEVIAASKPDEWRRIDPENTLYMDFPNGRVIIELAPHFAPNHVANIRALSREGFWTNGAVTRVQDNFVTQWAQAAEPAAAKVASAAAGTFRVVQFDVLPDPIRSRRGGIRRWILGRGTRTAFG